MIATGGMHGHKRTVALRHISGNNLPGIVYDGFEPGLEPIDYGGIGSGSVRKSYDVGQNERFYVRVTGSGWADGTVYELFYRFEELEF